MEWFSQIITGLKIPLKILLPVTWIFSGFMILANDETLQRLYLFEWKRGKGFLLGLIFIISSCFLLVYTIIYIIKVIKSSISHLTLKRKTLKRITQMSDVEVSLIAHLYHCKGYTDWADYNQPFVKGLLARNYIYAGEQQMVTTNIFTNDIPMNVMLQPFVVQTLDYYIPKIKEEIDKLNKRMLHLKNGDAKEKITSQIETMGSFYTFFTR